MQAAYFLLGNMFTLLVGFPLQVFVARQLGAGELGMFSVAEGIMGLMGSLLSFGLAQALVKFVPACLEQKDYQGVRTLVIRGGQMLLSVGLFAVLASWLLLPLAREYWGALQQYPYLLTAMSWMIPLGLMMYFLQQGLRGFQEIGFVVVSNSFLQLGIKAVLATVLLWLGFRLGGYVLAVVASSTVACCLLALGLWRKVSALPVTDPQQTRSFDRRWFEYSRVMYGNSLLSIGATYLDRFLLGLLDGSAPVGILLVTKQLQQMPGVFLQMFMAVVTPMFSAAHVRDDKAERQQLLHFTVDWVTRLSAPICIFLLLYAEPLLNLYGNEFAEKGALPLRILVIAQLSHLAIGPLASLLGMSGKENFLLKLAVGEQVLIITGMFLLVPRYELTGAALTLALNALWQNAAILYVARKDFAIRWLNRRYWRWPLPTLASVAAGGGMLMYGPSEPGILTLALTMLFIYAVFNLVFLMQGLHPDDQLLFAYIRERILVKRGLLGVIKDMIYQHVLSKLADMRGRGVYSLHADQFKCIFIHIPKAAGTSVALTLFNQGSSHIPWFDYYNANPDKFRRYYKFSFVRNPWDRVVSTYFFLKRGGMNEADAAWAKANLANYPTFESFVKGWLNEDNIHSWEHFRPQYYFICDEEGRVQVDFVGRVENMEHDFNVVAARLGCSRPLAKVNVGNLKHYSQYYTEESREIVARVYARDVELFKYTFETV